MSHRYLRRLAAVLAPHGRVCSIDLPGSGANATPAHPLTVETFAALIGHALDMAGISSCVLLGHSMGAQFAVELAVRRPALVSHVVLVSPVVDPERRSTVHQALGLAADSLLESPSANAIVFSDYWRCGPRWYFASLPAMLDYPIENRIRLVEQPVLVLRGSRDPIARGPWCRELAGRARDGRFAEVEGQPHVVQHSAPDEVAAQILAFLAAPVGRGA
ncbi:alpha/beta hydrolase [Marisediminicola antarctica]